MIRRLMDEVARPNGTAGLFLAGIVASEVVALLPDAPAEAVEAAIGCMAFCLGGYAGSLWANWGGGE